MRPEAYNFGKKLFYKKWLKWIMWVVSGIYFSIILHYYIYKASKAGNLIKYFFNFSETKLYNKN